MSQENKKMYCCFCGKEINSRTCNNPAPVVNVEGAGCCAECNRKIVLSARGFDTKGGDFRTLRELLTKPSIQATMELYQNATEEREESNV